MDVANQDQRLSTLENNKLGIPSAQATSVFSIAAIGKPMHVLAIDLIVKLVQRVALAVVATKFTC